MPNMPQTILKPGEEIGTSEWLVVDQEQINLFGKVTLDPDPMHVDPEWARTRGPFGGPILFGFLTLSLLTYFFHRVFDVANLHEHFDQRNGVGVNYGFNRVRFIAPVPEGASIRASIRLKDVAENKPQVVLYTFDVAVEIQGKTTPALVAEWLWLWAPHGTLGGSAV
jgi:acyl dehydratase